MHTEDQNQHSPGAGRPGSEQLESGSADQSPVAFWKVRRMEKYNNEKDTMICFLRDDLENTWEAVAMPYNIRWNPCKDGASASALRQRYSTIVSKDVRASKIVGRISRGAIPQGIVYLPVNGNEATQLD